MRKAFHKLRECLAIYRQYRKHHSPMYAARIAFGCAFKDLPF